LSARSVRIIGSTSVKPAAGFRLHIGIVAREPGPLSMPSWTNARSSSTV
jgi:hypothetical protein